ncbi:MAG: zinc-ribbon domain-containing protein [Deltaproteobacteria bacterium]|nr:zinc-ribbon domain-containing protein [Deltaproteobacteria bacterium]MBW1870443.1 zinc-ribbon domain-containing protein [Deltaproteobacteria bacterium]
MKFVCDDCGTQYLISDEKVGPKGAKVRCKRCGNIIIVRPNKPRGQSDSGATDRGTDYSAETDVEGAPLPGDSDAGEPSGEQDELGQAFDQLLSGGIDVGDDDDDEDEDGATEIFSMDELHRLRSDKGLLQDDQSKIDQVFSEAERTDVNKPDDPDGQAREEWYCAIEDEQVGPLGLAEVENRWESGQISPDSLAWHPGMEDWKPVKDIPKLRYLLGTLKKEEVPASVEAAGSDSAKPAAGSSGWDTSGGSALASLVEEEIQAVESAPPPEDDELDMDGDEQAGLDEALPPWEKEDVVSGEVARPSESFFDSTLDQPTTDSGSVIKKRSGFSRPAYLSTSSGGGSSKKLIVIIAVCVVVVVVSAFAIIKMSSGEPDADPGKVQPLERPDGGKLVADGKSGTDPKGKTDGTAKPATDGGKSGASNNSGSKGDKENKDEIVVKKAGTDLNKKPDTKPPDKTGRKKITKKRKKKRKRKVISFTKTKDPRDKKPDREVTKPVEDTSNLPKTLSKNKISATMKKYVTAMRKCVKQQQNRDPSVTGTMLVSFVIVGSGKVSDVRIISAAHKDTFVAGCITFLIKSMKFPKFSGPSIPIPRLPLRLGG